MLSRMVSLPLVGSLLAFAGLSAASPLLADLEERASNTSGYRYLSSKTKPYQVESLPDVDYNLGEFYSGNVDIYPGKKDFNLFFAFKPAINAPTDTLTIWLNGGPGCSSMEGLLEENGPWTWRPGTNGPTYNNYTWANITNMLWVDQPVGTGFSQGAYNATLEEQTAAQFVAWFKNWQQLFGIKNYKIYVTGESYAGRYVPYISSAMVDQKDKQYFNYSGSIIYDPTIGDINTSQNTGVMPVVNNNQGSFGFNKTVMDNLNKVDQQCGFVDFRKKYLTYPPPGNQPSPATVNSQNSTNPNLAQCVNFNNNIANLATETNPCFDIYEVSEICPAPFDPIGTDPGQNPYFNRTDVKKAMHAPLSVDWSECNGNPFPVADLSADPIRKVLPQIIEASNRVLIGNGDLDMILPTLGTLLAIQNMTWNGKLGFQTKPSTPVEIVQPGQPVYTDAGVQLYERGLMWTETFLSGHMEPEFQPATTYRHLQWLLGMTDRL